MSAEKLQKHIDRELARGRKLLSAQRVGQPLTETAPQPAPEHLGALAGVGLRVAEHDLQGNLYVFATFEASAAAVQQLDGLTLPQGLHQVTAMNGPLVLLGQANLNAPEGRAARRLLNKMLAAFAGDE